VVLTVRVDSISSSGAIDFGSIGAQSLVGLQM